MKTADSQLTARQRRKTVAQLEEVLTEEKEKEVAPAIEERLVAAPPMPTTGQLLTAMNTRKIKNSTEKKKGRPKQGTPTDPRTRRKDDFAIALSKMEDGPAKKDTIRAAAQAAILLGQPSNLVAAQYGIPLASVEAWKDVVSYTEAIARRDRLSEMLMAFIEQEFKSLMAISIVTSQEEWIIEQSAGDLAAFVAVKADRVLTLLAAFGRTQESIKRISDQLEVVGSNG